MRRILRVVAVLVTIGAIVVVARVLARRRQPPAPAPADWPPLARERRADAPTSSTPEPTAKPAAKPAAATPTAQPAADADGWIDADDGACPTSHPVKAKLSSGIYHVPGGLNYERTKADRCYPTPDAAEGDGLRASKR